MAIEEFRELRMAAEELRSEIAIQLEIVRTVEDKLTTSAGAAYAVRNLPTKQIRDSLDKAFRQFVERRRAWRVALMHSCCLEEDMSLTEFAASLRLLPTVCPVPGGRGPESAVARLSFVPDRYLAPSLGHES